MPNHHSSNLGVFGWLQRLIRPRLQRAEGHRRHHRPGEAARSLELFRTIPFSPLDREIELYSSASIEERIPNRFDNETGVENDEDSESASSLPDVYELDASDMHEMNMTGRGPTVGTDLDVEYGVDETWSTASEMSVDRVIDTLQLSTPNAIKFLSSLDIVILEEMEEDARQCPICTDDYLAGEDCEVPVKLDCGHGMFPC